MIGKIVSILENSVVIGLTIDLGKVHNLINRYVLLQEGQRKVIGEVTRINKTEAIVQLLGEFISDKFTYGLLVKPSFSSEVYLLSDQEVKLMIGLHSEQPKKELLVGNSSIYSDIEVGVNINSFFGGHFAILGSTGSGKSCGFARMMQNLFLKEPFPVNSNIFIFDTYGEYHNAFQTLDQKSSEFHYKSYTTDLHNSEGSTLKIPVWLLGVDDLALLLGVTKASQLPIIEKMLRLVNVFVQNSKEITKYKNDIVARALLDILSSGRAASQIRDQIFSVLTYYHTPDLNLETPIVQPGYTRPLKHCLIIDDTGKIREMELLNNFFQQYIVEDLELKMPNGNIYYTLEDLESALNFALIGEGVLKSEKVFDDSNILKVRLHTLATSDIGEFFRYPNYISRNDYVKELLTCSDGKKAQIVNFNIHYVDDVYAKTITKIYSKLLFNYAREVPLNKRTKEPFHIVLEEAHRYVQNDNDIEVIGYNIFERITKEGRKYGVLLGLISQRPSELSSTSLSQCSNFLIFKMIHPYDVEYIYKMIPNITEDIIRQLKVIQPGSCIGFGSGFQLPIFIKLEMPNPAPSSSSCDIEGIWF